ncbi:MAG TPA: hypothetical protein VMJ10_27610 [Kofleriaceae bacterium]|nr:hypothetical protein [Kofleriaceae bacterium]
MLVFRSFTVGLLAACFIVLAYRPSVQIFMPRPPPPAPAPVRILPPAQTAPVPTGPATIIDVAHDYPIAQISSLVRLAPGERIVSTDERWMADQLDAVIALGGVANAVAGHYIDIAVAGPSGERRVLVLLH